MKDNSQSKRNELINTQADLDEYKNFQVWFNGVLEESINDVIYGIKEGTEAMKNGQDKIEMFKFIQTNIMKQNDFSLSMFKRYKEKGVDK